MTKEMVNIKWHEYRFNLTDEEAIRHIHRCLSATNPELKVGDISRARYAKEYRAKYRRSDGEEVSISVGIGNLKRYFGSMILGFDEHGIHFYRRGRGAVGGGKTSI